MTCRKCDEGSAALAAGLLRGGGVVVLPTDTVYGFSGIVDGGGQAFRADERIRAIKGRGDGKPFIRLLARPGDVLEYARDRIPGEILARWPGALTVVVRTADDGTTTAFRCPGDGWLRDVIARVGSPIYSTSVNRSGMPVLGDAQDIERAFGGEVDAVIDGGSLRGGVPSTMVAVGPDGSLTILRQGAVRL